MAYNLVMLSRSAITALLSLATACTFATSAQAKSWCANPVWVHEWGVNVFGPDGRPASAGPLPAWFHTRDQAGSRTPVRALPPDSGNRALPVLHFYATSHRTIPVGIEVGFPHGHASAWFPAVNTLRDAATANSDAAYAARRRLVELRNGRVPPWRLPVEPLPTATADPTAQLVWDRLELSRAAGRPAHATHEPWVASARDFSEALWVNSDDASERFVFYEGRTDERVPLRLARSDDNTRRFTMTNTAPHPVHDIVLTHRAAGEVFVVHVVRLGPGETAHFALDATTRPKDVRAATVDVLRDALIDHAAPTPPTEGRDPSKACVMQRDPAIPFTTSTGHRLFKHEVELVLDVWSERFFGSDGTTIVYREDSAALDAALPLSLHTDMFHHILLRRAGLGLWQGVPLP